jgi:hypothetical protein
MTTGEYCRAVEAYLCRINGGHLMRIVGPSFDRVCGWEAKGIVLRVVCQGIDRAAERHRSKGSRRPLHVDFCEADILDVFDEWRRALGLSMASGNAGTTRQAIASEPRQSPSLGAHLDRVIARLTARRSGGAGPLDALLEAMVRELDATRGGVRKARGHARTAVIDRLAELDRVLMARVWALADRDTRGWLGREADQELAAYASRMVPDAYARVREAGVNRLLRDRERLPVVTFDG